MAMSRLSVTVTAPIVLISVLAIGLTVFLNVGKLDRTLSELEDSRLRYTVNALRENLETGLDLGLPLPALGNAQAAIEQQAAQDSGILAIVVRDGGGEAVFHTGAAGDQASTKVSAPLSNNLGVTVGAVELLYARSSHDAFMAGISSRLIWAGLAATFLTTVAAMLAIHLWVRRINRTLATIASNLDPQVPSPAAPDPHAAALAQAACRAAAAARSELDAAAQALTSAESAGARL